MTLPGASSSNTSRTHVPGKPTVIVVNMPGTIGMPNWLYGVAEKDGTILGLPNLSVPMNQVIMPKNVRYDVTRFNWIGNLEGATGVVFTYHTSPTKTIRDAMTRETPSRRAVEKRHVLPAPGNVQQTAQYKIQDHRGLRAKSRRRDGKRRTGRDRVKHRKSGGACTTLAAEAS